MTANVQNGDAFPNPVISPLARKVAETDETVSALVPEVWDNVSPGTDPIQPNQRLEILFREHSHNKLRYRLPLRTEYTLKKRQTKKFL
jgi:hypothetical protein